jgi:hypothetical protein
MPWYFERCFTNLMDSERTERYTMENAIMALPEDHHTVLITSSVDNFRKTFIKIADEVMEK